jgi:hypothetical protein
MLLERGGGFCPAQPSPWRDIKFPQRCGLPFMQVVARDVAVKQSGQLSDASAHLP